MQVEYTKGAMKKVLFGIFAHPDDEAFGPSASLYKASESGTDVHLIVITDGEQGANPDKAPDLGALRIKEWRQSSRLIGAASTKSLHYPDGKLCSDNYLSIAGEIIEYILKTIGEYTVSTEIDFMTFDYQGISGHLDHIAASMIATYVYLQLKSDSSKIMQVRRLKYFCLSEALAPSANTSWMYMPAGRQHAHIDEKVGYEDIADKKLEIMKAHHSQRADCASIIAQRAHLSDHEKYCDHFHYFK